MTTKTKPSTKPATTKPAQELVTADERSFEYVPFGEAKLIKLSPSMVKNILAVRSRSGHEPGHADIVKFLVLCKSRLLNPFVGDAYLIGYETKEGEGQTARYFTKWNLITAVQALRKRAEGHPKYNGCECGVIVRRGDDIKELEGAFLLDGDVLLGGWAIVHRDDRKVAEKRRVKLATFNTGKSRWAKDPEGMIVKCAEAAALRAAFPSDLAGLYVSEEFDRVIEQPAAAITDGRAPAKDLDEVTRRIAASTTAAEGTDAPPSSEFDGVDPTVEDDGNQGESTDDGVQAPDNASQIGEMQMSYEEAAEMERLRREQEGLEDEPETPPPAADPPAKKRGKQRQGTLVDDRQQYE